MSGKTNTAVALELEDCIEQETSLTESVDNRSTLRKVTDLYFAPKSFEKSGKVYEKLGVKTFKKFVPTAGDIVNSIIRKAFPKYGVVRNKKHLWSFEIATRVYEGAHFVGNAIFMEKIFGQIANGNYKEAAIDFTLNVFVDIYPIMLQRYNRARIYRGLERYTK